MTNILRASVHKVSFLLLLAFCLGATSSLYAAMYNEEQAAVSSSQPFTANNQPKTPQNDANDNGKGKKKPIAPLQHKLPTLQREQAENPPKLLETAKGQAPVQQKVEREDKTLTHSAAPQGYQIAANRKAATRKLLFIAGLPMGQFMLREISNGVTFSMIEETSSESE